MRFLILQHKLVPSHIAAAVVSILHNNGHSTVKWVAGITPLKDYDGVIAIPGFDYDLDSIALIRRDNKKPSIMMDDLIDDDIIDKDDFEDPTGGFKIRLGRGIYEGLVALQDLKLPGGLIGYDEEHDVDSLFLVTDFQLTPSSDQHNFSDWGVLTITKFSVIFELKDYNPNQKLSYNSQYVAPVVDFLADKTTNELLLLYPTLNK